MANDGTSLGDRMKRYENVTRYVLPRRTYTIVRVDGRAFHSLLKDAQRPYDYHVMDVMALVSQELCQDMAGAAIAYQQSDEVSVLLTDFQSVHTEPFFGGVIQKIATSAAATATWAWCREWKNNEGRFDARVFTIPERSEVANYFLWRQRDATRNSIMMAGQAAFPHSVLQHMNGNAIQELLFRDKQINWNDYPVRAKRGQVTEHTVSSRLVDRHKWTTYDAALWTHESLMDLIPNYG